MIYAVKTIVGREEVVLEAIANKAKTEKIGIKALVHPQELKGYIFVEGELEEVMRAVKNIMHVRGLMRKPVKLEQIENFLKPKEMEIKIERGDVVEVMSGPFKGTEGKVTRYDKIKREITLEPLETAVPIPITISVEFVKIKKRAEK